MMCLQFEWRNIVLSDDSFAHFGYISFSMRLSSNVAGSHMIHRILAISYNNNFFLLTMLCDKRDVLTVFVFLKAYA